MTTNRTVSCPLFNLPKEVRDTAIYPNYSPQDLCLFTLTSHQAKQETAFLRLLHTAVSAAPESYKQEDETTLAAITIFLTRDPESLFKRGTVIDHFGREIEASPYQLFLGAGDKWALKQVHAAIIPKIEGGEREAQKQFKVQFPNCPWPFDPNKGEEALYDDRNKAQVAEVIAQLKTVVEQITADPCTNGQATLNETTEAVAKLCRIFAPKKGEIIKTGLHFPLAIMKEIYKEYDAQFYPWSAEQLSYFSLAVIGAAEEALTAVDGQCCKSGLKGLDMEKGPDRRDGLFCRHPKGIPQKLAPIVDKLGRTMFVDPYDGYSCFLSSKPGGVAWYDKKGKPAGTAGVAGLASATAVREIEKLINNKSINIGELLCSPAKSDQHIVSMTKRDA